MGPLASNSRCASRHSQSTTWRCTSGNDTLLRSGRGGKRPPRSSTPALFLALLPLSPHQEAVGQHHRHRMPVETGPQPPLVLVPAQFPLGFLVVLLDPVPPVRVLDQPRQLRPRPEVAPVVAALLRLAPRLPLPDQPAEVPPAIRRDPPAPQGRESAPQPPLAALTPADPTPRRRRQGLQGRVRTPTRFGPTAAVGHGEVAADGNDISLPPLLQAGQEVGVIAVIGVGGHAGVPHPPG